ncbi:MAG: hypothetical protein JSW54_10860 [Fidelibacterota bacterium]|nr:MAG: hypothetical protein JSW54_10860 [Candidatus Neomarinimicrobiota bacterium]
MVTPVHNAQWSPVTPVLWQPTSATSRDREIPRSKGGDLDVATDLSPLAVKLSEEGLDFSSSVVDALSARMDFNLEFTSGSIERLSASGYYSEETQSLSVSWHLIYQKEVTTAGGKELRTFEADLQVSASQVSRMEVSAYVHKEDIMSLVRRLLEDLHEIITDEDKALGGVILEYADFRELFALDHGKLAHDVMALINLTIMLARLKQVLDGDEEVVVLKPKRVETRGLAITKTDMRVESFKLEIRDVTAQLSTTSTGQIPDTSTYSSGDTMDSEGSDQQAQQVRNTAAGAPNPNYQV